jgi:hypothetical protein
VITPESTLADVCFLVAAALEQHGITSVLTGGSAAALYAPNAYMSSDADFILERDDPLATVEIALRPLGFARHGRSRMFEHPTSRFTVEFPRGPLSVGGDYIRETTLVERGGRQLRILTRTDCIRDRLAHYYFWDDFTALNAAVGVAAQNPQDVDFDRLRTWTQRESPALSGKLEEFERRLQAKLEACEPNSPRR